MSILVTHDNQLKDTQMDGIDVYVTAMNVDAPKEKVSTLGGTVRDPQWVDIDINSHRHRWYGKELPTLTKQVDTYWCEDCRDEHETITWLCRWCEAVVVPGTKQTGPSSVWIEGVASAHVSIAGSFGVYTVGGTYLFTSHQCAIEVICVGVSATSHGDSTCEFAGIGPMLYVDSIGPTDSLDDALGKLT